MVKSKKKPSYKLISTYKTELMGVATISVLIGHAGTAIIADMGAVLLIPKIATLICTLMYMFFFLSGFGCYYSCLLYTSPSPRDGLLSRMPSSA